MSIVKTIETREADFKKEIEIFTYPALLKEEFFNYWTEPNKSGTKLKFEMEKTWHLGRRLARWANNDYGKGMSKAQTNGQQKPKNPSEIDPLDRELLRYKDRPTNFPFEAFGKWYDELKTKKLLKPFTRQEVDEIKESYPTDNFKCRCAAVMMTFDWFCKQGQLFSDSLKMKV